MCSLRIKEWKSPLCVSYEALELVTCFLLQCINMSKQHQLFFIYGSNKRWRNTLNEARLLQSLYSLPFSPSLSVSASVIFETVLSFSLLDTPHMHTAPGPLVECCIMWGLWRKGIPGHGESTHTHANTHTQTNTAVESHHNPLADVQVKDEWWKASV